MSNKPNSESHIAAFLAQLGPAPKTLDEIARGIKCSPRNAARYLALAKAKVPDRFVETPGRRGRPATYAAAKTTPDSGEFFRELGRLASCLEGSAETIAFADSIRGLLRKFNPPKDANQQAKIVQLSPYYIVDNGPFAERPCPAGVIKKLVEAIDEGKRISFDYDADGKGRKKVASANPIRLVLRVGCLYLAATLADAPEVERSFRVAYISMLRTMDDMSAETRRTVEAIGRRVDRDGWFPGHFGQFRRTDLDPVEVRLKIRPENGNGEPDWLWRYAKRWSFKGARYDDKSCEMEFSVRATPDFVAWLAGQAPNVEVRAPKELRKAVAERVAAAAKLYGKKAR